MLQQIACVNDDGVDIREQSFAEPKRFVVCIFKMEDSMKDDAFRIFVAFEEAMRAHGGQIQLRSFRPDHWEIYEGRDHHIEPNHLNPAAFDFDSIMLAVFPDSDTVHAWWSSDQVFEVLKNRTSMQKMGFYVIEGCGAVDTFDISDSQKMAFGDKFVFFEFIKMLSFKPVQTYVDAYKRECLEFRAAGGDAILDHINLLCAEAVSNVLMNEFPLDAVCASSWRMRASPGLWYDTEVYQNKLAPLRLRGKFAHCLAMLIPMAEDKADLYLKAAKAMKAQSLAKTMFHLKS